MITKMADKMAATYQFAFVDNIPSSFIAWLPPNYIYIWITFIKLSVCPITKMSAKMAATYQFTLVDTLT